MTKKLTASRIPLKIALVILFSLLVAFEPNMIATDESGKSEQSVPKKCSGNLNQEAPETVEAVTKFWEQLRNGIRKNDKRELARMVHYPLAVFSDHKLQITTEQEFRQYYAEIFPQEFKQMLLRQPIECVGRVGVQGFSLSEGQIWFNRYSDGKYRIFSINVVVYPSD